MPRSIGAAAAIALLVALPTHTAFAASSARQSPLITTLQSFATNVFGDIEEFGQAIGRLGSAIQSATVSSLNHSSQTRIKLSQTFVGPGFSLQIPAGLIYSAPKPNYDTWRANDDSVVLVVQWESDSPSPELERNATVAAERADSNSIIAHPIVNGAIAPGIWQQNPLSTNDGSYDTSLFVAGANEDAYYIFGISTTPAAMLSVEKTISSFSLTKTP